MKTPEPILKGAPLSVQLSLLQCFEQHFRELAFMGIVMLWLLRAKYFKATRLRRDRLSLDAEVKHGTLRIRRNCRELFGGSLLLSDSPI